MDKELLRVVIIATGLLIIMGMLAWHFLKNKKFSQGMGFFAEQDYTGNINESLVINDDFDGRDDFEITPVEKSAESVASLLDDVDNDFEFDDEMVEPIPRFVDHVHVSLISRDARIAVPHEHHREHAEVGDEDVGRTALHFPSVQHFRR